MTAHGGIYDITMALKGHQQLHVTSACVEPKSFWIWFQVFQMIAETTVLKYIAPDLESLEKV